MTPPTVQFIPAAGGDFLPTDLASLHSWYDASNASTITESGGVVTLWESAHPTTVNNLTPPSGAEPSVNTGNLNSLDTMAFSTVASALSGATTGSATSTVYFIVKSNTTNRWLMMTYGGKYFFVSQSGSTSTAISSGAGSPVYYINGSSASWSTRGDVYADIGTSWNIVGATDVDLSSWSVFNLNGFSGYRIDGDYAEIIMCDDNLATSDREKVEGYLAHKWGLTANLPSGHPYKSTAP